MMKEMISFLRSPMRMVLLGLAVAGVLSVSAQSADESHDSRRYNAFLFMYNGSGDLSDPYFEAHYQWKNEAETNLLGYRGTFKTFLSMEEPTVEKIDSSLTKRAREHAIDILEHSVDVAWSNMGGRLTSLMNIYHDRVQSIPNYSGTAQAFEYFTMNEQKYLCGIKALQDSYEPNSLKKREYTALVDDIMAGINDITKYLAFCRIKDSVELPDKTARMRPSIGSIAAAARSRWVYIANSVK